MNIYLVYSEENGNGNTVQCDTLSELIYEVKRCCANDKIKNVVITTIQNGKPQ